MCKLGLASIAFRNLTVEQIIAVAKEAGLSYIEWGSDVHAPKDDLKNIDRVRSLTEAAGLRCSSYGTYFRIDRDPIEDILGYIQAAKRLGVDTLRIWCPGNPATLTQEDLQQRYATCRALAKIAQEQGVVLCAECHYANLTDNAESSLAFMQAVNCAAFRMYWQPNENFTAEENLHFVTQVQPYVTNVHVYNRHGVDWYPLAEATDAWLQYMQVLGKDRLYILEHMPEPDVQILPREAATLRSFFA